MEGPRLDHQKTDRYRYEASESSVQIFGSFFGLKSAGKLGLVNQFKVNSHDLRQIEIPSPSNNVHAGGPGKKLPPGFACVVVHHSLFIKCSPSDITTAAEDDQRKDHLAEEQQDDAADTEQPKLLHHGLALIRHGVPLHARHFVIDSAFGFIDDVRRKSQTLQVLNENQTRDQLIQSGRQEPCIQQ